MIPKMGIAVGLSVAMLLAPVSYAHAQAPTVDTSQPIAVKSNKPKTPKLLKFNGEFQSSTSEAVTVRDLNGSYLVRTFTYGPEARAKMQQITAQGGFHFGDQIEIDYAAGTDVALRIKGKPSSKTN